MPCQAINFCHLAMCTWHILAFGGTFRHSMLAVTWQDSFFYNSGSHSTRLPHHTLYWIEECVWCSIHYRLVPWWLSDFARFCFHTSFIHTYVIDFFFRSLIWSWENVMLFSCELICCESIWLLQSACSSTFPLLFAVFRQM